MGPEGTTRPHPHYRLGIAAGPWPAANCCADRLREVAPGAGGRNALGAVANRGGRGAGDAYAMPTRGCG
eukprot:1586048-Lingulodinium_polyedra.AAC.1